MAFASENSHWYTPSGQPCHTVLSAKGAERNTTLRDARKMNLSPSVTSVIKVMAAPGLERWKREQSMLAALTLPKNDGESEYMWFKRVREDAMEQAKEAAEEGTRIHGAIERHFSDQTVTREYEPFTRGVEHALHESCGEQKWSTERTFTSNFGYGGCMDLHSKEWVVDFKGKEFSAGDDLKTYDEHHMQLAAYRRGLGSYCRRAAIVFVSRNEPGLCQFHEIEEEDLERGWAMFFSCLTLWMAQKRYAPEAT